MDNRSTNLFDEAQPCARHHTTHVHAYLRHAAGEGYVVFVTRYRDMDGARGVRGYPLGATRVQRVELAPRFSAKRLATLAADPAVLDLARHLAAQES